MNLKNYLEQNKANKQIEKLAKICKNKKVVFYGAGDFFYKIKENYDLSKFNVLGIADLKFATNPEENKTGFSTLVPDDLKTADYDAIIITMFDDIMILNILEHKILKNSKNRNVDIYPIMTPTIGYLLKQLFQKN